MRSGLSSTNSFETKTFVMTFIPRTPHLTKYYLCKWLEVISGKRFCPISAEMICEVQTTKTANKNVSSEWVSMMGEGLS